MIRTINSCHVCFDTNVDDDFICDICDKHYCEKCSYTYSIHYQEQKSLCYKCSDQSRKYKLDSNLVLENKLKLDILIREDKFDNLL